MRRGAVTADFIWMKEEAPVKLRLQMPVFGYLPCWWVLVDVGGLK
ncbi:hypothetical protein CI238_09013, partial [Colletotrichum incanum]